MTVSFPEPARGIHEGREDKCVAVQDPRHRSEVRRAEGLANVGEAMLTMKRSRLARNAAADTMRTVGAVRVAGSCVVAVTSASRSILLDIVDCT